MYVREVLDSLKEGGMDDVDDEALHLTGVVTLNLGVLLLKVCVVQISPSRQTKADACMPVLV